MAPPVTMLPQRKFIRGFNASTPAITQPQGTLPRGSNLTLAKRGGLRVAYGSSTYSLLNGALAANASIADMLLLQTIGVTPVLIAAVFDAAAGVYTLVYVPVGSYSLTGLGLIGPLLINATVPPTTPRLMQFNDQVIITLGNNTTPNYWCGVSVVTNSWTASTLTALNTIIGIDRGAYFDVFRATFITGNTKTGTTQPNWDVSPGNTTVDNNVTWTYLGQNKPAPLVNIFQVVYPQWLPTTTITPNTVIQVGFYGTGVYGSWLGNHNYAFGTIIKDSNGNLQQVVLANGSTSGFGKSSPTVPTWGTAIGQQTTDNQLVWQCLGPAATTAATLLLYWQPSTRYNFGYIIDPNNNVQRAGDNDPTGTSEPANWGTTIGATTTDGSTVWTNKGPATFYNFTAVQGGTTGAGPQPPHFSSAINSRLADNNVVWQNTGLTSQSSQPPRGARSAVVYAGSLWVLNTSPFTTSDRADGPTALRMSELNNPNSWNPINIAFLGKDDGTVGTGLATFTIAESGITPTGSLIAFKDYSTYQIIGVFGSDNFQIIQAQTDMGCIASDSIQFLPGYGIARLTHLGPALFNGVRDQLFGEEIRPYIFGDVPDITQVDATFISRAFSAQCTDPPMYLLAVPMPGTNGGLTRILAYDLVLKSWAAPIDLPWPISCIREIRQTGSGLTVITLTGGSTDGSFRQVFDDTGLTGWVDTPTVGTLTPVAWSVRTPEVFSKSVAEGVYARGLYVRGNGMASGIKATITADSGVVQALTMKQVQLANGDFEAWLPFHIICKTIHADLSGSGPGELYSFDWDAEPQPAAPQVLM